MGYRKLYMRNLISAIQFITILPVGRARSFDPPKMIPYFPIVGLALGSLTALFDLAAVNLWSKSVASLLDVVFLALLTGAFHIDGLGDTADGLLGQRSRDKTLAIMKDSRLGTMGLVAIVFCLSMKWGGITGLDAHRSIWLILVPAYARGGMLFGMRLLEYGRPAGGTGLEFFREKLGAAAFCGLIVPLALSVLLGWKALWLNLGFGAITAVIIWYYKKRIGCITGDMLGAMTEILEAGLFLLASVGGKI
jgi:adenosylcobinamide-GDP ribazoletransferase